MKSFGFRIFWNPFESVAIIVPVVLFVLIMKSNLCSVLIAGITLLPSVHAAGPFELPSLPYGYSSLEPHISQLTLEIHHDKHHAKYVSTMNSMISGATEFENMSLAEIVKASYGKDQGLFNNAAQSWNHEFYWKCMTPDYKSPPKSLVKMINQSFGSVKSFKEKFSKAGNTAFGSGWAWLWSGDGSELNLLLLLLHCTLRVSDRATCRSHCSTGTCCVK